MGRTIRYAEPKLCKCGCGKLTSGRVTKINGQECEPEYKKGHYQVELRKGKSSWNKGLTGKTNPSVARQGRPKGSKWPYGSFSTLNERLKNDPELKEKWRQAKLGIPAWNKGLKKHLYPNGIKSGSEHGNWKGVGNIRDQECYRELRAFIFKRDRGKCTKCGAKGDEVHHIIPVSVDKDKVLDPFNLITVCKSCHKVLHSELRKKLSGK